MVRPMSSRTALCTAEGFQPDWTLTVVPLTPDERGQQPPLASLDDRALVDACIAGRPGAFDALMERHQRAVYQLCYRFARTRDDAADLAQEVFLRAFRGLRRFRGESALGTWLYRIGVNVCLNRVAARHATEVPLDAAPPLAATGTDPDAALVQARRRARVRAAVARLPRKQRATLVLRVYHDLSHQEVAEALGTTVGAVKANLFHALGNLRRMLAGESR